MSLGTSPAIAICTGCTRNCWPLFPNTARWLVSRARTIPRWWPAHSKEKIFCFSPDQVFPVEVHWNAKSGSVSRILEAWNIAADSVIFVDDSPMELAEVAAVHPGH